MQILLLPRILKIVLIVSSIRFADSKKTKVRSLVKEFKSFYFCISEVGKKPRKVKLSQAIPLAQIADNIEDAPGKGMI